MGAGTVCQTDGIGARILLITKRIAWRIGTAAGGVTGADKALTGCGAERVTWRIGTGAVAVAGADQTAIDTGIRAVERSRRAGSVGLTVETARTAPLRIE
jgi:hypothetical protein